MSIEFLKGQPEPGNILQFFFLMKRSTFQEFGLFLVQIVLYNVQANGVLLASRDMRTVANCWQVSAIK